MYTSHPVLSIRIQQHPVPGNPGRRFIIGRRRAYYRVAGTERKLPYDTVSKRKFDFRAFAFLKFSPWAPACSAVLSAERRGLSAS